MQPNIEFCVYGGFNDEVFGVQEYPPTSLLDENVYYRAPLDPAYSGSYVSYLNGDVNAYNSGYYQESSYQCYYPLTNYEYYPDNVYYPYHVYVPVYCYYFVPIYDYYLPRSEYVVSGSNYEYYPDNVYYPYHVYVPVYCYYFVPTYVYYLPRSEYVVSGSNGFEQDPFDQRSLLPTSVEPNLFAYEECGYTLYNNEYRSFSDGSVEELVDDEITSFHISYTEYPENLVEAGNKDEDESSSCDKKLVENVVPNRADVNVFTVLVQPDEQPGGVYMNICDDDVEENIIKKVSLMSIAEVQKDIDETYEYGKADLYNDVLKGYTGIKSTLEELEWECHSLDDIPEEEEPEDDSYDMDFDENVLKNIHLKGDLDKNKFPDIEDSSHFAPDSLSEESPIASSQEALIENCEIMVEENELSTDSSIAEENDTSDPVLEHSLCEEQQYSGSVNANQEDYPPVDSPVSEDKHKMISVSDVCSTREEIHSGTVSGTEEACPYMDSAVIEENCKMNSVEDLCLSKEKIDSVSLGNNEEPHVNVPSEDRGEETPVILEPASERKPRKKRFSSLRKFFGRICCCVKKPS